MPVMNSMTFAALLLGSAALSSMCLATARASSTPSNTRSNISFCRRERSNTTPRRCDAPSTRWRAAVQPLLDARGLESAQELDDGDLLELAGGAMPMATSWEALLAEHADEFAVLA